MHDARTIVIRPARNLLGSLRVPGDKSISHRYAMLAALASGRSRFDNFAPGADCASTLGCVRELGCKVEREENNVVTIEGRGAQLEAPTRALDCGNSGSTMRMLSGILAGQSFTSELIGDASLSRRPMQRIIEPLTQMGAKIEASDGDRAPLRIAGGRLRGIDYRPQVASAQVKTSVLFAGLLADGKTSVEEPARTRDLVSSRCAPSERSSNGRALRSRLPEARPCIPLRHTCPETSRRPHSSYAPPRSSLNRTW